MEIRRIEPLDPWLTCGPDTSVQELWRVEEEDGRRRVYHMVFNDKHGWYCEHGRSCPAVAAVRKFTRQFTKHVFRNGNRYGEGR